MRISATFCITGWLAVYLSTVRAICMLWTHDSWERISKISSYWNFLYGFVCDSTTGSFIPGLWKASHWLWDWNFLLCGNVWPLNILILLSLCILAMPLVFSFFFNEFFMLKLSKLVNIQQQVPVFIVEIAPKNLRGGLTTLNQVEKIKTFFLHHVLETNKLLANKLKQNKNGYVI